MERKFGIEMEIVGISKEVALRSLQAVGVQAVDAGYTHTVMECWKIVSDSSVQGGFEVVSPVLSGTSGLETVRTVAQALADAGATANRSCGLHVHVDAHGMTLDNLRSIVTRYAAHEAEIDSFMPRSRRGDENFYCASLHNLVSSRAFREADTVEKLVRAQRSRYHKVNLHSYLRYGTVEFRQHSGTVQATKICNWLCLLLAFVDQCCATAAVVTEQPVHGRQGELLEMLRQGAVSVEAMQSRWSWTAHTARAAITRLRRCGLQIDFVEGRYLLRRRSCEDSLWSGVAENVRTFYRNRAAVLAVI